MAGAVKRNKQLWDKVASLENLMEAAQETMRGKRGKRAGATFPVFHPVGLIRLGRPISKIKHAAYSGGSAIPEQKALPRFHYHSGITAPSFSIRADRAGSALPVSDEPRRAIVIRRVK